MPHWKTVYESDYLGSVDLNGKRLTATFAKVGKELVTGDAGRKETCVVGHFTDSNLKPMILNRTNCKMMQKLTGSGDMDAWKNATVEIGTEKVKFQGEIVDGLRIKALGKKAAEKPSTEQTAASQEVPQQTANPLTCEGCGGEIKAGYGMTAEELSAYTFNSYGKHLCAECAMKAAK